MLKSTPVPQRRAPVNPSNGMESATSLVRALFGKARNSGSSRVAHPVRFGGRAWTYTRTPADFTDFSSIWILRNTWPDFSLYGMYIHLTLSG